MIIKKLLRNYFSSNDHIIKNLGYSINNFGRKRALVCYLVDPYSKNIESFKYNTNRVECLLIVESLIGMGYLVDIVYCNSQADNCDSYDLIFGFGKAFRSAVKKNPNAKKILYLTEAHPKISYLYEKKRLSNFNFRYKSKCKIERSGTYYVELDFLIVDSILCLGDYHYNYLTDLYPNKKIEFIYPIGVVPNENILSHCYSNESLIKDILWFGSRGIIHKGLDVLIDALRDLDNIQLHVCGVEEDKLKKYIKMIPNNVVVHGVVDPKSNDFLNITSKCDYMFLPSASEGVPTSAITCMYAGLIPVITENCGTNFDGNAVIIPEENIGDLRELISKLTSSKISFSRKKKLSEYAFSKFNVHEFSNELNRKLRKIISE
ncbi:glycosyltransferase [Grimontia hollisae]|uniref:glycosyltransferase n=1 Tax=Grimontia hollisae TaxID=673 RepID=UPI0013035FEA|nr:glycosyltransferase [Grimontia hollisae]